MPIPLPSSETLASRHRHRHGVYCSQLIQEAGILLRLPQAVMATAQILLHRFFHRRSFLLFDPRRISSSCLWLSIKLQESSTRDNLPPWLPRVLDVFQRIRARRADETADADSFDVRKKELLRLESQILVDLGFVCHVEHPHKFLLSYLNSLRASPQLVQESWNLVNDSLHTNLCVTFPCNVVVCGVIYAAARRLGVPLPENPPWWLLFDVTLEQILEVCRTLADLYRQPKVRYTEIRNSAPSETSSVDVSSESLIQDNKASDRGVPISDGKNVAQPCQDLRQSVDTVECSQHISVLSPGAASKLINSYFLNASGLPKLKGVFLGGVLVAQHKLQSEGSQIKQQLFSGESKRDSRELDRGTKKGSQKRSYDELHGSQKTEYRTREDVDREGSTRSKYRSRRREDNSPIYQGDNYRYLSRYSHHPKHHHRHQREYGRR